MHKYMKWYAHSTVAQPVAAGLMPGNIENVAYLSLRLHANFVFTVR